MLWSIIGLHRSKVCYGMNEWSSFSSMDCYRWEDNMPMGCDCERSAVNFLFCNHHYKGNRSFAILSQSNEIHFHCTKSTLFQWKINMFIHQVMNSMLPELAWTKVDGEKQPTAVSPVILWLCSTQKVNLWWIHQHKC